MQTRSSVLGKRSNLSIDIPTPDPTPNPKRVKTSSVTVHDGDSNKENVPPFRLQALNDSPRSTRSLRRRRTGSASPSRTPRRHTSTSNLVLPSTPSTTISHLSIATPPSTPPSLQPLHSRARALLRATCNSDGEVAGREDERKTIYNFLRSFLLPDGDSLDKQDASTLYISGSPGTGKTALVNAVLRGLDSDEKDAGRIICVNCMALDGVDALYSRLAEELNCGKKATKSVKARKLKTKELVEDMLSRVSSKSIVVLDELDHIASSPQALTSLFSLAHSYRSTIRIIGIANTHTLTSTSQVLTRGSDDIETLHFAPYTPQQLLKILQTRLAPLSDDAPSAAAKFLPSPTLTLLTKKIATQTGDVRALFEVLRGAVDAATATSATKGLDETSNPFDTPLLVVTPSHILAALKAYTPSSTQSSSSSPTTSFNSEIVTKVRDLGLQARLVVLCALLASKRLEAGLTLSGSLPASPAGSPTKRTQSTGNVGNVAGTVAGIDPSHLHAYYMAVLKRSSNDAFTPVSRSEFSDVLGLLETVGLITLSSSASAMQGTASGKAGRRNFSRSASFGSGVTKGPKGQMLKMSAGVRGDEVLRGLGITDAATPVNGREVKRDVREEEVRVIWHREQVRLSRSVKERANSNSRSNDPAFDGAVED